MESERECSAADESPDSPPVGKSLFGLVGGRLPPAFAVAPVSRIMRPPAGVQAS